MYLLRPAGESDYEFCRKMGHSGLRPVVEKVRGWNQENEDRGFEEHWSREDIRIIRVDGEDAGYIKVETRDAYLYLDGIYLNEKWRSKGIGGKVVKDIVDSAKVPVRLRVFRISRAHELYTRLGFRIEEATETQFIMEHVGGDK